MRKVMTKEVTKTNVKVARMEMQNGSPVAVQLPDEILLGNVSSEKAQKEISKRYDFNVTVFEVTPVTDVYELPVEEFIKIAKIKEAEEQTPEYA